VYPNLFSLKFRGILLSNFKYRDRATIIGDILDTIYRDPKGKTKTSIMRATNLNFDQANKYLDHLIVSNIMKATDPLRSQEAARYKLTEKGITLLKNFHMWQVMLARTRGE